MTIRVSSGLRAALLSDYGLRAMMDYGVIEIYTGVQPVSASLAPTGTLIGRVTNNGVAFVAGTPSGGLRVDLGVNGGLVKVGAWRLKGVATGDIGWWRWKWNSPDPGTDSQYYPRMDGAFGESLELSVGTLTPASNLLIEEFTVNFME